MMNPRSAMRVGHHNRSGLRQRFSQMSMACDLLTYALVSQLRALEKCRNGFGRRRQSRQMVDLLERLGALAAVDPGVPMFKT